jgi:hypothetical protein
MAIVARGEPTDMWNHQWLVVVLVAMGSSLAAQPPSVEGDWLGTLVVARRSCGSCCTSPAATPGS